MKPSTRKSAIPERHVRRRLLTVYGRKAVQEALLDPTLSCRTLHVATSNREGGILREISELAARRGVERREHTREELARISRNGRQDQGVALDVLCDETRELDDYLRGGLPSPVRLIAMDGLTNPQNVGMIIRSAVAAGIDGILYADRGNPVLGPLVIKASAGTVFRAPLLRCERLPAALGQLLESGFTLYRLEAGGDTNVFARAFDERAVFVLGGESEGLSEAVRKLPGIGLSIPMRNGVESLNVAVSAALLAYAATGGA
jgi:23S rRNA (guanosine2251-2'-O)-methyltransferase